MAAYPPLGSAPWYEQLRLYIDENVGQPGPQGEPGDIGEAVDSSVFAGHPPFDSYDLASQTFRGLIADDVTISVSDMPVVPAGKTGGFTVRMEQDVTGGWDVSFTGFLRTDEVDPVIYTTPGAVALLTFFWDGVSWWVFLNARTEV